jgi:hypothetical protein
MIRENREESSIKNKLPSFILTEKTLLSEQGQSSLAMPVNKTGEYWSIGELEYWNKNRRF